MTQVDNTAMDSCKAGCQFLLHRLQIPVTQVDNRLVSFKPTMENEQRSRTVVRGCLKSVR